MQDKLTIITTTHLSPSDRIKEKGVRNPDIELLKYVYEDLIKYVGKNIRWIISLDFKTQTDDCILYKNNIQKYINTLPNAELLLTGGWRENMTKAKNMVKTPYFLFWEHDWIFNSSSIKPKTVPALLDIMDNYQNINYVRFNKRQHNKNLDLIQGTCTYINNIPLISMGNWSNNPHICRTDFWKKTAYPSLLKLKVDPNHLSTEYDFKRMINRENLINTWGIYLYGDFNQPQSVIHLNGNTWTK